MRSLFLLLLGAALAQGQDELAVPAFRVDLLPGGRANVVVDQKVHPMDQARAAQIKAQVDALDLPAIRSDLSKLRALERQAAESEKEMETRTKALERENGRVRQAEQQIASLEKRKEQLEEQVRRAQRNRQDNEDDLRQQVSSVNASLVQERKDLSRARENLGRAQRNRKETEGAHKAAQGQAEALRKSVASRVAKVRELLSKELGA